MATIQGATVSWRGDDVRGGRALDITINQGSTVSIPLTFTVSGSPFDWTGYTFAAKCRESLPDGDIVFSFTVSAPVPANGVVVLSLTSALTAALTSTSQQRIVDLGFWDLESISPAAITKREFEGILRMSQESTT